MKVVVEVAGWAELHPLSQLYSARLYRWQGKMMELEQYQQQLLGIFLPNLSSCSERAVRDTLLMVQPSSK